MARTKGSASKVSEISTARGNRSSRKLAEPCSACGVRKGHAEGCANQACSECGMMASSHAATCSRHPHWSVDGTTGEVTVDAPRSVRTEVDGEAADVHFRTSDAEDDPDDDSSDNDGDAEKERAVEPPPTIADANLIAALQRAYDEGRITGVKQPKASAKNCEAYRLQGSTEIGCSARASFRALDENPCPTCEKLISKKHDYFCIVHAALWVDGQPTNPQMEMTL